MPEKESLGTKKVSPAMATVFLLDEIAGRLQKLEKQLPIRPEGITEPLTPVRVTTTPRVIHPPLRSKLWFAVSIVNDGPDDCWIILNTEKSTPQPYLTRAGETYEADFGSPVIEDIRVYTTAGTANLRVRGIR